MTKDQFQRVDDTFIKHFLNLFMNDASFSRRDSVGSLVDWSMITSKNPVFHIRSRLSTCRSSGSAFGFHGHSSRDDFAVSNCRLVTQTSLFPLRYVGWAMDGVAIFSRRAKCFLRRQEPHLCLLGPIHPDTVILVKERFKCIVPGGIQIPGRHAAREPRQMSSQNNKFILSTVYNGLRRSKSPKS
ncbi:hypothetical protein TNCV_2132441 [Trichonephila clavipes]|nr:hypothetical protein TNCV_2132441 [Trichonephila clavipes]